MSPCPSCGGAGHEPERSYWPGHLPTCWRCKGSGEVLSRSDVAQAVLDRAEVVHTPEFSAGRYRVQVDGLTVTTLQPYPEGGGEAGYPYPPYDSPVCAETRPACQQLLDELRAQALRVLLHELVG